MLSYHYEKGEQLVAKDDANYMWATWEKGSRWVIYSFELDEERPASSVCVIRKRNTPDYYTLASGTVEKNWDRLQFRGETLRTKNVEVTIREK